MTFTRRLRKNFAWVLAPPIGLVALQSGEAVGQLALASVGVDTTGGALVAALARPRAAPPPFHETSAAAILARNPFDSQTGPFGPPLGPAEPADPGGVPACDRLRVVAIAASSEADWSLAVLADRAGSRTLLRRRNGEVGELRVEHIGWDRVWMSGPRGLCQAAMFAPPAEPANPVAGADAGAPGEGAPLASWIAQGIETVSPTEHAIDRALVPRILEGRTELLRGVQVAPELIGGKIAGARLLGVKPDSLLGRLGILSGDRLETINGYDLTSTQAAVEAYAHLQTADRLILQVNRGGSEVRLQLDIR